MQNQKRPLNSQANDSEITKIIDESCKILMELAQDALVISAMGASGLVKIIMRHPLWSCATLYGFYVITRAIVRDSFYLELLFKMWPEVFAEDWPHWIQRFSLNQHHFTVLAFILFWVCLALGVRMRFIRTKFIKFFSQVGLNNGNGDTPKLVHRSRLDKYRVQYDFDSNGISLSQFKDKREGLEASFRKNIESIKHGKNKGRVLITLNKQDFPKKVTYSKLLAKSPLPENSFFIGHSINGPLSQNITELPHMLIAGATGSGKSIFFKQMLMGLLESTPHIQMYLIDLKGGLEMKDFKAAPNVRVLKTIGDSLKILEHIYAEMMSRFDELEKSGRKQIIPGVDKKDRIIVAVDEASVLYMKRNQYDPNKDDVLKARQLADSISRLSRASAIHLILSTQKVDKSVIPTSVTENISGRMAFRANSLQGSMVVLGCKDAADLPEIVGRGIWSFGTTKRTIQAPYIGAKFIRKRCEEMKKEFKKKERECLDLMIGDKELREGRRSRDDAYGDASLNSKSDSPRSKD